MGYKIPPQIAYWVNRVRLAQRFGFQAFMDYDKLKPQELTAIIAVLESDANMQKRKSDRQKRGR